MLLSTSSGSLWIVSISQAANIGKTMKEKRRELSLLRIGASLLNTFNQSVNWPSHIVPTHGCLSQMMVVLYALLAGGSMGCCGIGARVRRALSYRLSVSALAVQGGGTPTMSIGHVGFLLVITMLLGIVFVGGILLLFCCLPAGIVFIVIGIGLTMMVIDEEKDARRLP